VRPSVRTLAAICAAGALTACGGGGTARSVAPFLYGGKHAPVAHHVAAIEPPGHIAAGSREYTYSFVVVHGADGRNRTFAAPRSVTAVPGGVRVVDGVGDIIDVARGAIVAKGTGRYYVRPGQHLPRWIANATAGRTFTTTAYPSAPMF
jgi:hypothetical protein